MLICPPVDNGQEVVTVDAIIELVIDEFDLAEAEWSWKR